MWCVRIICIPFQSWLRSSGNQQSLILRKIHCFQFANPHLGNVQARMSKRNHLLPQLSCSHEQVHSGGWYGPDGSSGLRWDGIANDSRCISYCWVAHVPPWRGRWKIWPKKKKVISWCFTHLHLVVSLLSLEALDGSANWQRTPDTSGPDWRRWASSSTAMMTHLSFQSCSTCQAKWCK